MEFNYDYEVADDYLPYDAYLNTYLMLCNQKPIEIIDMKVIGNADVESSFNGKLLSWGIVAAVIIGGIILLCLYTPLGGSLISGVASSAVKAGEKAAEKYVKRNMYSARGGYLNG
jgi:hypothetical protein